ncbi:MAG: zinc ABC transporter substrate-binding protein [Clostridia bacterium]|nr:zinc ABC transporter substrate-binding protein [Clostridia bacterium]
MLRRVISTCLIVILLVGTLSACGNETLKTENDKLNIVCTTFPVYDWVKNIIGEKADQFSVTLLGSGELHSFQPKTQEIAKIHTADLFLLIGGVSDEWTKDMDLDDKKVLKLFELLNDNEKLISGDEHTNHSHHQHKDEEYDEHIWLSLKLAKRIVNSICTYLCDLDPANGIYYQKNTAEYVKKLEELDGKYKKAAEQSQDKTVIFADRFPFAYLTNDYGIRTYAAFSGCSSDTDASFETVTNLAEKIIEYKKDTVLVLENSNEEVVKSLQNIVVGTKIETAIMDSCQTIDREMEDSINYIDLMEQNLKSLERALR